MFVKDVVLLACKELGLLEVADEIKSGQVSGGVQAEIDRLVGAINLAVETIVSSDCSVVLSEEVVSDAEGKVPLSDFARGVYMVLDAKSCDSGESVDYLLMPFHLYLPDKNARFSVTYKAGSKPVEKLDDQIEIPPFVGLGVLTRAVVYEYLLSKNCYSEATFWKESFEDAFSRAKIKNKKYRFKTYTNWL